MVLASPPLPHPPPPCPHVDSDDVNTLTGKMYNRSLSNFCPRVLAGRDLVIPTVRMCVLSNF